IDADRTTADLRFCHEQFESIRSDLKDFASGLRSIQLEWHPEESVWSIAQCVEHLNNATENDVARLSGLVVLARAARRSSIGPYRCRRDTPVLIMHESPRHSLTTATGIRSAPFVDDPAKLVPRFLVLNGQLLGVIATAARVAADGTSASGNVLLDLVGHVLQLNALHHWRFILQARRVMERPGFPRS
ncbi:MAG: DinB family protein, partial [bacterium]|nr:DinB family protein [Candidatus Kapabacteria bacterium]